MQKDIKRVSYQSSNSYETQNEFTSRTKNIWMVFHGIGYLSKYFLKYFEHLNAEENYIIAPQAPSKYYLKNEYKYVGASWLTKIDTKNEIKNNLAYLDAVADVEQLTNSKDLVLFAFSQGVSVLTRWMVSRKIKPKKVILYAGGIPNELTKEDFVYLNSESTEFSIVYGKTDMFLNEERLQKEIEKIKKLFPNRAEVIRFDGGHEIKPEIITELTPND